MPFYDFKCHVCDCLEPRYRKISERDDTELHCGQPMQRVISAPALRLEIQAYVSPTTGRWINSRAQRTEDLLSSGAILREPGLDADIAQIQASEKEKIAQKLDRTVDETVSAMHACNLI